MVEAVKEIIIRGAEENNLHSVNLRIPKQKLVVVTGVSGSGKTSLVYDTIAVEAKRQMNDMFPTYIRSRLPHYEAPHVMAVEHLSAPVVIQQRIPSTDSRATVGTITDIMPLVRLLFSRLAEPSVGISAAYSFNHPLGMCPVCAGLGKKVAFDIDKIFDKRKSLNQNAILLPGYQIGSYQWQMYANCGLFDVDKPLGQYTEEEWQQLLHGSGLCVDIYNNTGKVWGETYKLTYEGLLDRITRLYIQNADRSNSKTVQKILQQFTSETVCDSCHGARVNTKVLESRLRGKNIYEISRMEISELTAFFAGFENTHGDEIAQKIREKLYCMVRIGLNYLSLGQPTETLSGGEMQRLKIVRCLNSSLNDLLYIFDEPSAGLHAKDVERLAELLISIRDRGNSLIVVEHHPDIIKIADEILELGPGAGRNGGRVVFQGTYPELLRTSGDMAKIMGKRIPLKQSVRTASGYISITDASENNLRHVSIQVPLHCMTVIFGVAGSGKTTLACNTLRKQYPEAVFVSQAPPGNTPRATLATYIGIMDEIRKLLAWEHGVSASLFSFNAKGACSSCKGSGEVRIEMAFMEPVSMPCEVCGGARYSKDALRYRYREKNILEILHLTVEDATVFFRDSPKISKKLEILQEVGIGYASIGQPLNTFSGGECQRIKLASYLGKSNAVFVLDEPMTGLHRKDIERLLCLLNRMVDQKNTLILVEHHLEVIAQADWLIELGPGGGKEGGTVLFEGTPMQILHTERSVTAEYLKRRM